MPHIHKKIDFTAQVWIVHKDKVLIRKHDKYGYLLGVGGHIELDEDPNIAAIREAKEEVGLDVRLVAPPNFISYEKEGYKELIPPIFMNIHKINETHQHVGMEFVAVSDSDKVVPENKDDEWKWLTPEEVENNSELSNETKRRAAADSGKS